jgi:hypothetical protein
VSLVNVPTVFVRTEQQAEAMIARLTGQQATVWCPKAREGAYCLIGYRFAAMIHQNTIELYAVTRDGRRGTFEAIVALEPPPAPAPPVVPDLRTATAGNTGRLSAAPFTKEAA